MRFWRHKWVRRLVVWVLLPVVLGVGFYQYNYPTCTFRYKLTAEVMTPQGLKTGSSVIEVSYSHNADWGGGQSANLHMIGEAVYVNLGQAKNLFVTLRSHESGRLTNRERAYALLEDALDGYEVPLKALKLRWSFGEERNLCAAVQRMPAGEVGYLAFENLPTLVTFKDVSNPMSVVVIQPDELGKTFGAEYELQSVRAEISDAQPSDVIYNILPWLESKRPKDGSVFWSLGDPLIDRLHFTSFKMPN